MLIDKFLFSSENIDIYNIRRHRLLLVFIVYASNTTGKRLNEERWNTTHDQLVQESKHEDKYMDWH